MSQPAFPTPPAGPGHSGALPCPPLPPPPPYSGVGFGQPIPLPTPSALPRFPGFTDAAFGTPTIQPPPHTAYPQDPSAPPPEPNYERAIPPLQQVRSALNQHAAQECCYGQPDEGLQIQCIEMKSAFKYNLVSFTEQRKTIWVTEPYSGQIVDAGGLSAVMGPWDIVVYPDLIFREEIKEIRVPNTAYVRTCADCGGAGTVVCDNCSGMGNESCSFCRGSGRSFDAICSSCNGAGRKGCGSCFARGRTTCRPCAGQGQLFLYLQLIVTWKNFKDEFVSGTTIPMDRIRRAAGQCAVSEQNAPMVAAFTNFPDASITNASRDLIRKHMRACEDKMSILEQKQTVEIVPIAKVQYSWGKDSGFFHVYGYEHRVYFPDYPNSCVCCTIM